MNFYATATPQALIAATTQSLQAHGHQIVGAPGGPYADVSLLKTDQNIGPQLAASIGTNGGPWYVIISQA